LWLQFINKVGGWRLWLMLEVQFYFTFKIKFYALILWLQFSDRIYGFLMTSYILIFNFEF